MRELRRALAAAMGIAFAADRRRALVAFVAMPAVSLLGALQPLWLKLLLDGVISHDRGQVVAASVVEGVLVTASLLLILVWVSAGMRLRENIDRELDLRLIRLSAGVPGIEHHERPEYLDRLELLRVERSAFAGIIDSMGSALQLAVAVATTGVLLAGVHPAMLALPVFALPAFVLGSRGARRLREVEGATAADQRRALHLFGLVTRPGPAKELRVFRLEGMMAGRHRRLQGGVDDRLTAANTTTARERSAGYAIFAVGYVGALALVVAEAASGRAGAGDVLLAVSAAAAVRDQVGGAAELIQGLTAGRQIIGRYLWLADYAEGARQRTAPRTGWSGAMPPAVLVEGITLHGLSFRYADQDHVVLRDVDLHLAAGSVVAVVGENGAGKSTLVKLLARLYEPTEGHITVDGRPLTSIDPHAWQGRLAGAFEDFMQYELEAREVVGIGDLPALGDLAAVERAVARAGAGDVVAALPDGLATVLGPGRGGRDLSKGQWQKLALARGLMRRRPLLLLLDEPTAALDAETEHALFERYAEEARSSEGGSITVLVSHRFSTVRMADLILVIDGARVAERGSHEELMAQGGLYAELYGLQADGYR